jgi:hypothetical protein
MGLLNWAPPSNGVLVSAPHYPSIAHLLDVPPKDRAQLELFIDMSFQIEPDIVPELGVTGKLRPLVHTMMASQLRFLQERLQRYGDEASFVDRLARAAVKAGFVPNDKSAALSWLKTNGEKVRTKYDSDNLSLTTQPGGGGGMESVVAILQKLTTVVMSEGKKEEIVSAHSDE